MQGQQNEVALQQYQTYRNKFSTINCGKNKCHYVTRMERHIRGESGNGTYITQDENLTM